MVDLCTVLPSRTPSITAYHSEVKAKEQAISQYCNYISLHAISRHSLHHV
jgi:hypothetical protein